MTAFDEEIRAYYDRGEEASRLETFHPLERLRTLELLERLLPSPPASVIDIGAARAFTPSGWPSEATRSTW